MDARQLAEKILMKIDKKRMTDILNKESADRERDGIDMFMSDAEKKNFTADDVVREIESLLGV